MIKLKNILNEYGGSEFSKITSLQNFLTIDLDKFEKGLKDSKHKAAYKKARKQFMKVVSDVAWEHHKLHEGKDSDGFDDHIVLSTANKISAVNLEKELDKAKIPYKTEKLGKVVMFIFKSYRDHEKAEAVIRKKRIQLESLNEAVPVTDKLIMKMKPGSSIKVKGSFLRSILLTKDKYGNWRSESDPNDILVNRQIAKIVKGKKAHKAGNTYMIEDTVTEATATIAISQEDMDKLHGDGTITVDGVTITYQEPANPQPQDEVKESKIIKLKDLLEE